MSVHSGKFAVVNGHSTVRNWSINDTMTPAKGVASNTKFGTFRKKGVRAWTGSFSAYGGLPLVMPGETFAFTGYTAPTNDISGNGIQYSGNAIVDSIAITWNYAAGEPLSYVVNFSGDMVLTVSVAAAPTDVTAVDAPPVCPTKWQFDNSGSYVDLPNVAQAVWTLTAANQGYVNSSTASGGHCWTGRRSGPLDWTLAITIQDDVRTATVPLIGDDCKLKGFIDGTNFWELWWGHTREYTGITVDRESSAIIQATLNFDMNAYNSALGKIRKPGGVSDWWPV